MTTMIASKHSKTLHWVEKYRPGAMEDLIGQDETVAVLRQLVAGGRTAGDIPHLLFYGPPGTGKTSTILALAKDMYGKNWRNMVLELNASDDRGINVVRDEIKTFAGTRQLFSTGGIKLVILDEADAMTPPAQAALRRVIEQFTKHTRFCLICNYSSKIIQALQSRCTRFRFQPLPQASVRGRVATIIEQEGLAVDDDGLTALVTLGHGDMRRSLNILQSVAMEEGTINAEAVYHCTGHPLPREIREITGWLVTEPFDRAVSLLDDLRVRRGLALVDIVAEVHALLLTLNVGQQALTHLLRGLADLEDRLSRGTNDAVQLHSLVGLFTLARGMGEPINVPTNRRVEARSAGKKGLLLLLGRRHDLLVDEEGGELTVHKHLANQIPPTNKFALHVQLGKGGPVAELFHADSASGEARTLRVPTTNDWPAGAAAPSGANDAPRCASNSTVLAEKPHCGAVGEPFMYKKTG
eukprot:CAMPEP_0170732126 /NCGR_PEP_ID=MMETSP0437-20130122/1395_1 /TAXON_ID=0 /ORGANISM="Sexangularia sp." /LENGTH=467 /DNA_ID=CAMNT_0011070361 /DNA_START=110 /DNA_END=1515 /DNA_ORIENTATION=-